MKVYLQNIIDQPYVDVLLFLAQWKRAASSGTLRTGDVYVTRHSNLTEVHVVFHMVIDDSLRSSKSCNFSVT